MTSSPWSLAWTSTSVRKSTWSPLYRGLLPAAACGPPGKKKFGNPRVCRPRNVVGPSAQCSVSSSPSRPTIPMRDSAPVPKSKPVAHTMMSNSRTPSVVSIPVSVSRTIGVSRRSTSDTFGSLNASKYPVTNGRPLLAEPVVRGDQPLGRLRVVDDAADLVGDELAPLGVGRLVEQQVGVVARELHEAGAVPHRLVERLALGLGVVERGALVHRVGEAADRRVQDLAQVLEVGPELHLLLGR